MGNSVSFTVNRFYMYWLKEYKNSTLSIVPIVWAIPADAVCLVASQYDVFVLDSDLLVDELLPIRPAVVLGQRCFLISLKRVSCSLLYRLHHQSEKERRRNTHKPCHIY